MIDRCVVVNHERVVLGLLREKEQEASELEALVEVVMRPGPTTFRPNTPVGKVAKRMRDRGTHAVLVTTSVGRLIGLLLREDAQLSHRGAFRGG
jgi:CBS domain-containing protein